MFRPEVQYINLGKLLIIGYNRTHAGKQSRFHQQDCQNPSIVKPRFVALRAVCSFYPVGKFCYRRTRRGTTSSLPALELSFSRAMGIRRLYYSELEDNNQHFHEPSELLSSALRERHIIYVGEIVTRPDGNK
jgi:hypothetical protein